jgi:DNA polymerase phi
MSTTLPLFWKLSSADRNERLIASVKLVGALERLQTSFKSNALNMENGKQGSDESEDAEDEDDNDNKQGDGNHSVAKADLLDQLNASDVSYAVRRLVRGLASPRESSRLGFAVALTEVCVEVSDLL